MTDLKPGDSAGPADDLLLDPEVLRRRRERVFTFLALFAILGIAAGLAHYVLRSGPPPSATDVITAAHNAVRGRIPGIALQFAAEDETSLKPAGEGLYEVAAHFVAITSEGRTSNYRFVCTLERRPDGVMRTVGLSIKPAF